MDTYTEPGTTKEHRHPKADSKGCARLASLPNDKRPCR